MQLGPSICAVTRMKGQLMDRNIQNDVECFEHFLVQKGFSLDCANEITTKGFRAAQLTGNDAVEVSDIVSELKVRQQILTMKRFREEFQIWAPPYPIGHWGKWYRMKAVTSHPTERSYFAMKFASTAGDLTGPYEIEVQYVGPSGRVTKKLLSPGSAKFEVPQNSIQEPKVRARSLTLNGQLIRTLKY